MGNVTVEAPVFSRGSTVLEYWLVHAEGLTVEPLGAIVEEVVKATPDARPERLIVRSRRTRLRRSIDADAIAAVEPAAGTLLLEGVERHPHLRAGRDHAVRAADAAHTATLAAAAWTRPRAARTGAAVVLHSRTAAAWTRPRAARAAVATARGCRSAGLRTARGIRWLAPRVVAATRTAAVAAGVVALTVMTAAARGAAHAARSVEDAAERRRRRYTVE